MRISPALACIHLNPVRPGVGEDPLDYPWRSYKAYASGAVDDLLDQRPLLAQFSKNPFRARKEFVRFVKSRLGKGKREEFYKAKDQRFLGPEELWRRFRKGCGREAFWGIRFRFRKSLQGSFPVWEYQRKSIYSENRNRSSRTRLRLLFSSCSLYRNGFPDGKNLLPGLCNDLLVNLVCNPENSLD